MTALVMGGRLSGGGFTGLLAVVSRAGTVDSWNRFTMTLRLTCEVINCVSGLALLPDGHESQNHHLMCPSRDPFIGCPFSSRDKAPEDEDLGEI